MALPLNGRARYYSEGMSYESRRRGLEDAGIVGGYRAGSLGLALALAVYLGILAGAWIEAVSEWTARWLAF
tara:strand:- start:336 stop:548 length:213 start_codon:yes stop_codon:yes gene_type:complete